MVSSFCLGLVRLVVGAEILRERGYSEEQISRLPENARVVRVGGETRIYGLSSDVQVPPGIASQWVGGVGGYARVLEPGFTKTSLTEGPSETVFVLPQRREGETYAFDPVEGRIEERRREIAPGLVATESPTYGPGGRVVGTARTGFVRTTPTTVSRVGAGAPSEEISAFMEAGNVVQAAARIVGSEPEELEAYNRRVAEINTLVDVLNRQTARFERRRPSKAELEKYNAAVASYKRMTGELARQHPEIYGSVLVLGRKHPPGVRAVLKRMKEVRRLYQPPEFARYEIGEKPEGFRAELPSAGLEYAFRPTKLGYVIDKKVLSGYKAGYGIPDVKKLVTPEEAGFVMVKEPLTGEISFSDWRIREAARQNLAMGAGAAFAVAGLPLFAAGGLEALAAGGLKQAVLWGAPAATWLGTQAVWSPIVEKELMPKIWAAMPIYEDWLFRC